MRGLLLIALAFLWTTPALARPNCLRQALAGDPANVRLMCSDTLTQSIVIRRDVKIDGNGQTIDGNGLLLQIERGATVVLRNIRLHGIGIQNRGTLRLERAVLKAAQTGIYNTGALSMTDSLVAQHDNGIANYGGSVVVENVTFWQNRRAGLYNSKHASVLRCTFSENYRGIDNASGDVVVANTIFQGNNATRPHEIGAGIANSGKLQVYNSSFLENKAAGGGAAFGSHLGGTAKVANTLIASDSPQVNCMGPIIDGGHNRQYPGQTCGTTIPQYDGANPGSGDPAICNAQPVAGVDRLGAKRKQQCDIGAVEISAR